MSVDRQIPNKFLFRSVAYRRAFERVAGSASTGLFVNQLFFWDQRAGHEDGGAVFVIFSRHPVCNEVLISRSTNRKKEIQRQLCKPRGQK